MHKWNWNVVTKGAYSWARTITLLRCWHAVLVRSMPNMLDPIESKFTWPVNEIPLLFRLIFILQVLKPLFLFSDKVQEGWLQCALRCQNSCWNTSFNSPGAKSSLINGTTHKVCKYVLHFEDIYLGFLFLQPQITVSSLLISLLLPALSFLNSHNLALWGNDLPWRFRF